MRSVYEIARVTPKWSAATEDGVGSGGCDSDDDDDDVKLTGR